MNEEIFSLLGVDPKSAKEKAFTRGLLSTIFNAAALSGPQARPVGNAQALGQLGLGAIEAYDTSIDRTLKEIMTAQQMKDLQAKRARETAQQTALTQFASTLPADQRALAQAFPEQFATQRFAQAPGVVGEFQAAKAAGEVPPTTTLTEYIAMKRPPGTTVNVGGDKDPFALEAAKKQADVFSGISAAGSTAAKNLQNVKRLENTLSRVETGGAAAFKQFAGNFGIKTEGLDDIQAATAIINRLVPEQRAPGSGPMSDADLELFKQSLPRIINTPGGNKKIVEGLKEINNYIVKEAKIANDVLSKKITPEEGRNKLLELGDPVQDFFERNQAASPGSPRVGLPQADQDLINRYLRR
jgi:hypothetical protein